MLFYTRTYNPKKFFAGLAILVLLVLHSACKTGGCIDPTALNYNPQATVQTLKCYYAGWPDYNKFLGNWVYTDTFTWYPPAGGPSRTTYTPYQVQITYYSDYELQLAGYENLPYYFVTWNGDTLTGTNQPETFTLSADSQLITFNDATTNSTVGYMRKQ
jgi:hypothetical protein